MKQSIFIWIVVLYSQYVFGMKEVVIDAPRGKTAQEILKISNSTQFKGQLHYLTTKHKKELINKKRSKAIQDPEKHLQDLEDLNNELDTLESALISETHALNQQAEKLFNNERLKDIGVGGIWLISALATGGSALYLVLSKDKKTDEKVGGGIPLFTGFLGFGYQAIQSFARAFNNDSINDKIDENLRKSKNVSDVRDSIEKSIKRLKKEQINNKEEMKFEEVSLEKDSK